MAVPPGLSYDTFQPDAACPAPPSRALGLVGMTMPDLWLLTPCHAQRRSGAARAS